jgi:drug/metabolite transporter (DMT)-like permease
MNASPFLKIIIASIIFGAGNTAVKILNMPSELITFYRLIVPAVILFIYLKYKKIKIFKKNTPYLLFGSTLNCVRMFLYFVALNLTTVGNSVTILYTWPIFASILGVIFLKEKLTKTQILLLLSAVIGVLIIFLNGKVSFSNKNFLGMTIMLCSALIYALSMIVFKKRAGDISSIETTFFQNFIGAIVFIPFVFTTNYPMSPGKISFTVLYAFMIGVVGFALFFSALKQTKANIASYFSYLEIPCAIFFGAIILHEKISWNLIIGASILITSVIIMKFLDQRKAEHVLKRIE